MLISPEAKNLTSFYLYCGVFEMLVGLHIGLFANSFIKANSRGLHRGFTSKFCFHDDLRTFWQETMP